MCPTIQIKCQKAKHLELKSLNIDKELTISIPSKDYKSVNELQKAIADAIIKDTREDSMRESTSNKLDSLSSIDHEPGWVKDFHKKFILPSLREPTEAEPISLGVIDSYIPIPDLKFFINFQSEGQQKHLEMSNNTDKVLLVGYPVVLAHILGIQNNVQPYQGVVIDNDHVWLYSKSGLTIKFPFLPDINRGRAKHAKILCNEVKPTLFGSRFEKLLSFCSLQSDSLLQEQETFFYEVNHPVENQINSKHINSLSIKITSENSDDEIMFENTESPVHIALIITKYD